MITAYVATKKNLVERSVVTAESVLPVVEALWLDLYEPTADERARVEAAIGLQLPTHEEMREIEPSSRLYAEDGAVFMTGTFISHADEAVPTSDAISFVLTQRTLLTVRYSDPRPIATFAQRLCKGPSTLLTGEDVFVGLLEAFVDRIADILERVAIDIDRTSRVIFDEANGAGRRDMQSIIRTLGRNEDLASSSRESLLSLTRLVRFHAATFEAESKKETKEMKARVRSLTRDIESLSEHVSYESHKINFLLDATLGQINIEQNRIIKLFSVVAVIFLPPTLVASIYGMNFHHMPELDWLWGYPWALGLMVLSAVLPLLYFWRKKWF
ncbi:MAG: magnesium/cobalt transporter CorA [Alphaproteobacteria bacterium]|nr:magnesium/cobalt transporter CorA [Alphaproteobacteria bacterium]